MQNIQQIVNSLIDKKAKQNKHLFTNKNEFINKIITI